MKTFTKLVLSITAALVFVASSFAGGYPQEKGIAPMQPAPACDWSGLYIGGNVGITEFYTRITDDNEFETFRTTSTADTGAFIGGAQIGYNYQLGQLVVGVELDASGSTAEIKKDPCVDNDCSPSGEGFHNTSRVDFLMTLRGRAGFSLDDNKFLLYATAGGAYAHGKWDSFYFDDPASNGNSTAADWRGDDWRWGWVGGFGAEYKFDCHWSVRGEALLTWLFEDTKPVTGPTGSDTFENERNNYKFTFSDDLYTFRVGVNYSFGSFFGH